MYIYLYVYIYDYIYATSLKPMWRLTKAITKMKYKHWAKDKIRVAAQIWLWERVAFIYIYITKLNDELTPSRKEAVF